MCLPGMYSAYGVSNPAETLLSTVHLHVHVIGFSKKGKQMFLADTFSGVHLYIVHACQASQEAESVDHTTLLALTEDRLYQFEHISADDPVLQEFRRTIQQG